MPTLRALTHMSTAWRQCRFDDAGKESAIVKSFAQRIRGSHPKLAAETTMMHWDSKGIRFLDNDIVSGNPNTIAKHVQAIFQMILGVIVLGLDACVLVWRSTAAS